MYSCVLVCMVYIACFVCIACIFLYFHVLFVSHVLHVLHVCVCIDMYICIACIVCIQCIALYWYVFIVLLVLYLLHVYVCIDCIACILIVLLVWCTMSCICFYWYLFACIDLYYISMDSMILFCPPIHDNTFQYISIRGQYFHACIYCINMYWFCQYNQKTYKYKSIHVQYTHDGAVFCGRQPPRIGMYLFVFCLYFDCIGLYLSVLGGGWRPQKTAPFYCLYWLY